ncbi:hypothetical protein ACKLNR_012116 [Fusarium oxysporum f. sp. zingiberi]
MAAISRRANSNSGGDESLLAAVVYIYKVLVKIAWHLAISSDTLESTEPATHIIILAQTLCNGWRNSYCVLYHKKWC